MKSIEEVIEYDGQQMDRITFGELIKELTGASFEEVYKDYLIEGEVENAESKSHLG